MKKILTIVLASALVLAIALPAMAMHFEMNGEYRARSWVLSNYVGGDDSSEFVDQRLRLGMKWGLTENVSINARADVLEGFWGDSVGSIREVSSVDPATGADVVNTEFFSTESKQQISFDHVYTMFTFPGAPLTLTIGRQDASWGPGAFVKSDNRDRFKAVYKGPVTFGLVYDKFKESFVANATDDTIQDNAGYGALVVGDTGGFKWGVIYYYLSNKSVPGSDTQQHSITPYLMGKAGPIDLKFELAYAFGETDANNVTTDREGLGIYAGAFMPAGMTTLGLELAYAQGNDPNTSDFEGAVNMDYDGPFWSVILYHNFDYDGFGGTTRSGGADRGVNNALALKGSVVAKASEKLALVGNVVWAQVDEPAAGQADDMGIEVDAIAVYNIYDNVAYTLGFGYLFAGDAFGDIDDPWGVLNRIEVKF